MARVRIGVQARRSGEGVKEELGVERMWRSEDKVETRKRQRGGGKEGRRSDENETKK